MVRFNDHEILDIGPDAFERLEPHWRSLEKGSDMTVFQSYDWYHQINIISQKERTKGLFRRLRYIMVSKDGIPSLIAPLEVRRAGIGYKGYGAPKRVYFIGRIGATDYLNFIYDNFDPDALDALIGYVMQKYSERRFTFDRMLEHTQSYLYLSGKYAVEKTPEDCAALFFPDSFDDYKSSLSKSTRQNIRTAHNRAKKDEVPLVHTFLHDEPRAVKEEIIALNEQRRHKKVKRARQEMSFAGSVYCFFSSIYHKLFTVKLDMVNDCKHTFCFLVRDDDKLVSFFWGVRNDYTNEYYVILAGVDSSYERYSPNISHLYSFIEEHYAQEHFPIRLLDFTRGAEGYKKTIGCSPRPVSTLRFRIPRK